MRRRHLRTSECGEIDFCLLGKCGENSIFAMESYRQTWREFDDGRAVKGLNGLMAKRDNCSAIL